MEDKVPIPDIYRIFAPWERATDKFLTPLERFIKSQTATALSLMLTTAIALILANSPLSEAYHHIFETPLSICIGDKCLSYSLHHWINEGLMTFFFFIIGLEIKREILVGELSDLRAALLPVLGAIGGMLFPALVFVMVNMGKPTISGWGIPMATDIAFAISVLVMLGRKIPPSLLTFLVALAIVDDLGAVLVIALFYTKSINFWALGVAGAILLALWICNRAGIHHVIPYLLGGIFVWAAMLVSGVHATVAGVLTAFTIPSKPKISPAHFIDALQMLLQRRCKYHPDPRVLTEEQRIMASAVEKIAVEVRSPLYRMEHALHLPVALIVIPLFALANAGVHLDLSVVKSVWQKPLSLGVMLGLLLGKPLGITTMAFLGRRFGIVSFPDGVRLCHYWGVGLLAGIGFTMSIFISELAFKGNAAFIEQAKAAIIMASFLAGVSGYLWLRFVSRVAPCKAWQKAKAQ
ncbi:Na+/H+ antiporter NhaA [Thermodesulfatator atlanticus]|uniref:Na+/H+ antiporter NhaA n=1 Tax=Thermodesulfatator atlanticus TaxID=501497 RepID=UPI0003B72A3E|nr:Na+/H+ antiporter NhaA [Thermodesulfatator atlanticus]